MSIEQKVLGELSTDEFTPVALVIETTGLRATQVRDALQRLRRRGLVDTGRREVDGEWLWWRRGPRQAS